MAFIFFRSSLVCFFVLVVLITYDHEIKFSQGRPLNNLMEMKLVISHSELGGRQMMQADSSSQMIIEKTIVAYKPISTTDNTILSDSTQQGHSPGVGHPFLSSKNAYEINEHANVEGKTTDYSPGVGHSLPTNDNGYAKPEAAAAAAGRGDGGGASVVVTDKRNAKAGKSDDDYSPGVGHSTPADHSDQNKHVVSMRNNKYLNDEKVAIDDHHSPGVGHSIQEKHAEPKARK